MGKTILAEIFGGITMNIIMLLTFRFMGFGVNGNGILLRPDIQSEKLIAVWTKIEPLPLVVNSPFPIITGIIIFGIIHAFIFKSISKVWPDGIISKGFRFGLIIFFICFLFWEFFTPFNLFSEPVSLILLELLFWFFIAIGDGIAISFVMNYKKNSNLSFKKV